MFRRPVKKSYRVVSVSDPAVDQERSDIDAYQETLDRSKLVFLDGQEPTEFELKTLGTRARGELQGLVHELVGDPTDMDAFVKRYTSKAWDVAGLKLRASLLEVIGMSDLEELPPRCGQFLPAEVLDDIPSPEVLLELASYVDRISHIPPQVGPSGEVTPSGGPHPQKEATSTTAQPASGPAGESGGNTSAVAG